MPCPTCDHTLESIGDYFIGIYHCSRCGTLTIKKTTTEEGDDDKLVECASTYAPKLVERHREFDAYMAEYDFFPSNDSTRFSESHTASEVLDALRSKWHQLGLAESINMPKDRRL